MTETLQCECVDKNAAMMENEEVHDMSVANYIALLLLDLYNSLFIETSDQNKMHQGHRISHRNIPLNI